MSPKEKGETESAPERFKKNLAALMAVPKAEIEELEAKRSKKTRNDPNPQKA